MTHFFPFWFLVTIGVGGITRVTRPSTKQYFRKLQIFYYYTYKVSQNMKPFSSKNGKMGTPCIFLYLHHQQPDLACPPLTRAVFCTQQSPCPGLSWCPAGSDTAAGASSAHPVTCQALYLWLQAEINCFNKYSVSKICPQFSTNTINRWTLLFWEIPSSIQSIELIIIITWVLWVNLSSSSFCAYSESFCCRDKLTDSSSDILEFNISIFDLVSSRVLLLRDDLLLSIDKSDSNSFI